MDFAYVLRGADGTAISRAGSGVLEPGLFKRRAQLAAEIEHGGVAPPGVAHPDKPDGQGTAVATHPNRCDPSTGGGHDP